MHSSDKYLEFKSTSFEDFQSWKMEIEFTLGKLNPNVFGSNFLLHNISIFYLNANRYHVKNIVTFGKYGEIVRAKDNDTTKLLTIQQSTNVYNVNCVAAVHELQVLNSFRHVNILSLIDVEINFGRLYMMTEVFHTTISELQTNSTLYNSFTDSDFIDVLNQILTGITFLHANGLIHCNIEPESILLFISQPVFIVKLTNFRMSQLTPGTRFKIEDNDGSDEDAIRALWYTAPELLPRGRTHRHVQSNVTHHNDVVDEALEFGPTVDVWSVACVFVELITRSVLFPGNSREVQSKLVSCIVGGRDEEDMQVQDLEEDVEAETDGTGTRRAVSQTPSPSSSPSGFHRTLQTVLPAHPQIASLLRSMLSLDPLKRISSRDALRHAAFIDPANELGPHPSSSDESSHNSKIVFTPGECARPTHLSSRIAFVEESVEQLRRQLHLYRARRPSRMSIEIDEDVLQDLELDLHFELAGTPASSPNRAKIGDSFAMGDLWEIEGEGSGRTRGKSILASPVVTAPDGTADVSLDDVKAPPSRLGSPPAHKFASATSTLLSNPQLEAIESKTLKSNSAKKSARMGSSRSAPSTPNLDYHVSPTPLSTPDPSHFMPVLGTDDDRDMATVPVQKASTRKKSSAMSFSQKMTSVSEFETLGSDLSPRVPSGLLSPLSPTALASSSSSSAASSRTNSPANKTIGGMSTLSPLSLSPVARSSPTSIGAANSGMEGVSGAVSPVGSKGPKPGHKPSLLTAVPALSITTLQPVLPEELTGQFVSVRSARSPQTVFFNDDAPTTSRSPRNLSAISFQGEDASSARGSPRGQSPLLGAKEVTTTQGHSHSHRQGQSQGQGSTRTVRTPFPSPAVTPQLHMSVILQLPQDDTTAASSSSSSISASHEPFHQSPTSSTKLRHPKGMHASPLLAVSGEGEGGGEEGFLSSFPVLQKLASVRPSSPQIAVAQIAQPMTTPSDGSHPRERDHMFRKSSPSIIAPSLSDEDRAGGDPATDQPDILATKISGFPVRHPTLPPIRSSIIATESAYLKEKKSHPPQL